MKENFRKRGKLIFSKEVWGCNLEKMFFFFMFYRLQIIQTKQDPYPKANQSMEKCYFGVT